MSSSSTVSFLLIGAQKAGTTSLARHLGAHPQIFVPAAKELEFFSVDERYARGFDWYRQTYFEEAPEGCVLGEASTHYMMFPSVPLRIKEHLPDVKLIALLRNPIDRAYSHHRMSSMRGDDTRPFEQAIADCMSKGDAGPIDVARDYVRFGEYGRVLNSYLEHFDRSRLLVLFSDDFDRDPAATLASAYRFLGVDEEFRPPDMTRRYNVGGEARAPELATVLRRIAGRAHRTPVLRRYMTTARYDAVKLWLRTELGVRRRSAPGPSTEIRRTLARHYRSDIDLLERTCGVRAPWPEL